jgi:hypothetical protein
MPLRKIPKPVPADQEVITASVGYKAASGIDFLEFRAYVPVCPPGVMGRYAYAMEGWRVFHHRDKAVYVDVVTDLELYDVRVGKGLILRAAYHDAAFFKINLVHFRLLKPQR